MAGRVTPEEISRFLRDFDAIVTGEKSLREFNREANNDQKEATKRGGMRRFAPSERDEMSDIFDNE